MPKKYSYRDSHKYPSKGAEYEEHYLAGSWPRYVWSREQQVLLEILEKYFAGRDINLLDFACGTGRITSFLENRVKMSTGVDVSSSMLAIARKKLEHTKIIQADITTENILKPRKFNLITAFRFFANAEHELRSAAIKTLAELLAEDGYLIFNNHHNFHSPWIRWSYMRNHQKNPQSVYNVMTINGMKDLAGEVGLKIIEIYSVGFFHPPRIEVPQLIINSIENICCKFKCLTRFSESHIAVCSWCK